MARKAHLKQFAVLLPVYLNTYMTGTTTGWLPCAIYLYTEVDAKISLTPVDYFSLVSSSEAGKILLALPASWMMDKYGRVVNHKAAGYLHVAGWVIICFTDNLWVIHFARIILGGASACSIAAALIMVGEMSSATIRGRMTSLTQIFVLLGNATPAVIMAWYPSSQVLAYFITAISILCMIANQVLIESPYYLVSKSQTKQARENLAYLRTGYTEDEIDSEMDIIQTYIRKEQRHIRSISNFIGHLRLPFVRKPLITMFLLNFFNNSSGIPMLLSVCTIVLGENSLITKKCYFIVTIIVALIFGGAVISVIDSFSRKHFYIFGAISTGILQAINGFTWYIYNKEKSQYWYWLFFIGNLALGIFWNGILSPLKSTVRSEILPQAAKSTENILSLLAQALALGSSFLIYHYTSLNVAYWIYAFCCEVLALVIYVQVPDGRGKTLAWIQMELNDELA